MSNNRKIIEVNLEQLIPYDGNPRTVENPKYHDIKVSIRSRGLDHPFNITRRSNEDEKYMIKDGGNTRLQILRELYDEANTTEEKQRWFVQRCTLVPWVSEEDTLAGHMSENESRGDMTFLDKAKAAGRFRRLYESNDGAAISGRELARRITESGWTVNAGDLSRYEYVNKHLVELIPTILVNGAGHPTIKKIRSMENNFATYWESNTTAKNLGNETFLLLWHESLRQCDDEVIDFELIQRTMINAIMEKLSINYSQRGDIEACLHRVGSSPLPPLDTPPTTAKNTKRLASPRKDIGLTKGATVLTNAPRLATGKAEESTFETLHQQITDQALALGRSMPNEMIDMVMMTDDGIGFYMKLPEKSFTQADIDSGLAVHWWQLYALSGEPYLHEEFSGKTAHECTQTICDTVFGGDTELFMQVIYLATRCDVQPDADELPRTCIRNELRTLITQYQSLSQHQ